MESRRPLFAQLQLRFYGSCLSVTRKKSGKVPKQKKDQDEAYGSKGSVGGSNWELPSSVWGCSSSHCSRPRSAPKAGRSIHCLLRIYRRTKRRTRAANGKVAVVGEIVSELLGLPLVTCIWLEVRALHRALPPAVEHGGANAASGVAGKADCHDHP